MKIHDSAFKHGVLHEDAVQAADWPQCFFTEFFMDHFLASVDKDPTIHPDEQDHLITRAKKRYIDPRASQNAQIRIGTLVWYKIMMERELSVHFKTRFIHDGGRDPVLSVKFCRAVRSAWNRTREEIDKEAERQFSKLK